ncbi:DNA ligase/mRNA capping enzyme [Exidia glandulosa HHB12029]|uniref:DNA ligase/mRNA capping enzyme n=1 Tax=Exidia glandulosa HHB12029 TaxID=1314781 RepID=A0A166BR90_EXIGL|nr:DNA ligase/mRNA capping enzyme [Exidia glandulosa HHB12029]
MADELAEINGVKPKVLMEDGEQRTVSSMSSDSTYKVKRTADHYYCDCMAWRNAGGPTNARSCKHLKELLGDAYEDARCEWKDPEGFAERQAKKAGKGKGKGKAAAKKPAPKKKKAAADDEDDEDDAPKSKAKPASKKRKAAADDDDEDEDEEPKSKKAKPTKKAVYDDDEDEDDEPVKPTSKAKVKAPALLLANKWDLEKGPDPTGWWCSEKLDGVRAFYDKTFFSRLGNAFFAPDWFLEKLPKDVQLDGELFAGRSKFNDTVSVVKTKNSPHWKTIKFHIFDIPSHGDKPFEERLKLLEKLFGEGGSHACDHVVIVEQTAVKDRDHIFKMLKAVEAQGGEGLMLRKPKSTYVGSRSSTLLKIKTFHDAEARVTGHTKGRGKHVGVCGALICEMQSGKTFQCGSGLTDKQRKNPPAVGSIIVYRFQELTRDGVPRFPTFVGESADKTEPKDAELTKAAVDDAEDAA